MIIHSYGNEGAWDLTNLDKSQWDYVVVSSLSQAVDWLNATYGQDGGRKGINNLVVRTRGLSARLGGDPEITGIEVGHGDSAPVEIVNSSELDNLSNEDAKAIAHIGKFLNKNASVLFTACNASMNGPRFPTALFKALGARKKTLPFLQIKRRRILEH